MPLQRQLAHREERGLAQKHHAVPAVLADHLAATRRRLVGADGILPQAAGPVRRDHAVHGPGHRVLVNRDLGCKEARRAVVRGRRRNKPPEGHQRNPLQTLVAKVAPVCRFYVGEIGGKRRHAVNMAPHRDFYADGH